MRRRRLLYSICCIIGTLSFSILPANAQTDTVREAEAIVENLNKLMATWYAKQAEYHENSQKPVAGIAADFSTEDSVIIRRLQAITSQTLFPMVYNDEIRSYIQMYIKRTRLLSVVLGLAKYYFPLFEQTLDKHACPLELKYLAVIESALNPSAVSRAGATGLWQFMYNTGKMYGLEVNTLVDYRRDPLRATEAAAKYLKELNNIFWGDWVLAIAAYNCGPGNVKKAIARSGGKTNFWEIYEFLPRETRGYVPAFYGAWYAMKYYDKYGVEPAKMRFEQTDTFHVRNDLHLMQVAELLSLPIEEIRALNPQYKKDIIPASETSMPLTLPVRSILAFEIVKDTIHNWNRDLYFTQESINLTSSLSTMSSSTAISSGSSSADGYSIQPKRHVIKKGESLSSIAQKYKTTASELAKLNKIKTNTTLYPGKSLIVGYTKVPVAKPTPKPAPAQPTGNPAPNKDTLKTAGDKH